MSKLKSLSKLHQDAIIKAQNETDQNKAAAMAMIEKPIEMIKAIMLKHELAVIEVMRELHEAKDAAVRAEREACAKVCEEYETENDITATWLNIIATAIRARGQQ
jgi:putative heme iron utilization protein